MNSKKELTLQLSSSEQAAFIMHLAARNKRHDARNIDLFKALINGKEENIKTEIGANAYNVLKKRLMDRLLDFIATRTLETEVSTEVEIIKRLLLARKLFAFDNYKEAFKILHKTEQNAIAISHYTLLNEIYHTLIEHSHHELSKDQEELFKKTEANSLNFIEQEKLNMVYATIRKAYNQAEKSGIPLKLEELVQENYKKYRVDDKRGYSFQSLYQLALLADIEGAHTRNYQEVELFFIDRIDQLKGGAEDSEKMLLYHINLLYSVANIYFRKKDFKQSQAFLADMQTQMDRFNGKFRRQSTVKYTTLKALNYNYTGQHNLAATELDGLFELIEDSSDELWNAALTRIMIHFQQNELQQANKLLVKFQRSDNWYERHVGIDWVINKNFIEILLHVELDNIDFVESRINSFERKYKAYFKTADQIQGMEFLKLVKVYYKDKEIVNAESFKNTVEESLTYRTPDNEDILIMSYYAWLKAKMEGKEIYACTMDMLGVL